MLGELVFVWWYGWFGCVSSLLLILCLPLSASFTGSWAVKQKRCYCIKNICHRLGSAPEFVWAHTYNLQNEAVFPLFVLQVCRDEFDFIPHTWSILLILFLTSYAFLLCPEIRSWRYGEFYELYNVGKPAQRKNCLCFHFIYWCRDVIPKCQSLIELGWLKADVVKVRNLEAGGLIRELSCIVKYLTESCCPGRDIIV